MQTIRPRCVRFLKRDRKQNSLLIFHCGEETERDRQRGRLEIWMLSGLKPVRLRGV